jgi:hypothetical protein
MIVGDSIPRSLYVQNAAGQPLTYSTYALLQAAGISVTFYAATGIALASQPTITMPVAGVSGRHQLAFVMPDGLWTAKVTSTNANVYPVPTEFDGEGTTYDVDTLGSLIATSGGVAVSATSFSNSAEMYDGNSIDVSCSVPEAALTAIGAASLALCDSLVAEIKINATDSSAAATVGGLTEAITSDTSGARTVRVTLDAFPAALAVPVGGQQSVNATLHLKLTNGTKIITANSTSLIVKWKATTA